MARTLESCREFEKLRDYLVGRDPAGRRHAMAYYADLLHPEAGESWKPVRSSLPLADRDNAPVPDARRAGSYAARA